MSMELGQGVKNCPLRNEFILLGRHVISTFFLFLYMAVAYDSLETLWENCLNICGCIGLVKY